MYLLRLPTLWLFYGSMHTFYSLQRISLYCIFRVVLLFTKWAYSGTKSNVHCQFVRYLRFGGSHFENAHVYNIGWLMKFRIAYDHKQNESFQMKIHKVCTVSRPFWIWWQPFCKCACL